VQRIVVLFPCPALFAPPRLFFAPKAAADAKLVAKSKTSKATAPTLTKAKPESACCSAADITVFSLYSNEGKSKESMVLYTQL
jgi:hypothetical protein